MASYDPPGESAPLLDAFASIDLLPELGPAMLGFPPREFCDACPVALWHCNAEGACDYVNPALCALFGYPKEHFQGRSWDDMIHPDDIVLLIARLHDAIVGRTRFECAFRVVRPDGAVHGVMGCANPIVGAEGQFLGLAGVTLPSPFDWGG